MQQYPVVYKMQKYPIVPKLQHYPAVPKIHEKKDFTCEIIANVPPVS